jgi:hypothetical protein
MNLGGPDCSCKAYVKWNAVGRSISELMSNARNSLPPLPPEVKKSNVHVFYSCLHSVVPANPRNHTDSHLHHHVWHSRHFNPSYRLQLSVSCNCQNTQHFCRHAVVAVRHTTSQVYKTNTHTLKTKKPHTGFAQCNATLLARSPSMHLEISCDWLTRPTSTVASLDPTDSTALALHACHVALLIWTPKFGPPNVKTKYTWRLNRPGLKLIIHLSEVTKLRTLAANLHSPICLHDAVLKHGSDLTRTYT